VSRRVLNEPPPPADQRIPYGDHPSQFVDYRYPSGRGPHPLAIYIHGGFWRARIDLTHGGHPCAALTAAGFTTANIEYRRAGEEGGGWPGTLGDVRRAVEFVLRGAGLPARAAGPGGPPHVLLGHSAGGPLALCLAAEMPDLRRVIALAPVADPRRAYELTLGDGAVADFFRGSPADFPERYAMRPPACPTVLIHGAADEVVPIELNRGFPGVQFIELPGADHFDVIDPQSAAFAETLRAARA